MPALETSSGVSVEELLLTPEAPSRIDGVVIATVVGFDDGGSPRVSFTGNPLRRPVSALTTIPIGLGDVEKEVVVSFEQGDPARPIVLGKLWQPSPVPPPAPVAASVDGERLVLTAEKEIVLQCGSASLTLTKAGKVLIRGDYILSRSSGVNRIKGGSVQIN